MEKENETMEKEDETMEQQEETMEHRQKSPKRTSRRHFLKNTAIAGAGLSLAGTGLLRPARAAQSTVRFSGWAFEPQVVEANVNRFMEQNPDIKVEYTPLDLQLYNEKMVALFNAGTQPDAFYVRDINLGAWIEAGWLQPIDGMDKLDELNADMYPHNREALFYKGKQYGTPYYGDIYVYIYDKKALADAGISEAPVTLEQLTATALELKKAGVTKYPILKGFKTNVDGLSEFWSMVFASGGHLFDDENNPVYPSEDKTALSLLEWMLEAMHGLEILDPRGLEFDETQARDIFLSGQGIFTSNVGNVFPRVNNPKHSKRAGNIQIMKFPGLKDVGMGPMGWTRLYGMSSKTDVSKAASRLMYYMGGKDKTGVYYTAKDWYLKYGVGYCFKPLDKDPDIAKAQQVAGYYLEIRSHQYGNARARENIKAPWYNEWDRYTQQQIQIALLRQSTPREALEASAKKAVELKKEWG
jgi:multiple sugar transport system substrate-binding protein